MSSFDRLVARALRQPAAPETSCPAPEALVAYLEGALTRTEHDAVEHHASLCPRCAQHLAALVQLDDQLGAAADRQAPWGWRHRWPWLVPAAAAVVAAVVWTAVPNREMTDLPPRAKTIASPARTVPPADAPLADATPTTPVSESRKALPVGEQRALESTPPASQAPALDEGRHGDRLAQPKAPAPAAAGAGAPAAVPSLPAPVLDAREFAPQARAQSSPEALNEVVRRADVAPAPPLPEAPAEPARVAAADALRKDKSEAAAETAQSGARDQAAEERPAQPLSQGGMARPATAAAKAAPDVARQRSNLAAAPLVIASPDPGVLWRAVGAIVERTTDGGRTWQVERAPSLPDTVVGSAPSADVCWLAGGNGMVLRRDAAGRWTELSAPTRERIVRIDATSTSAATVTTAAGRTLATTDGGRTWSEPR